MGIVNFKRWGVRILANGMECDGSMCVVPDGGYVKFEDAEASSNSLQQLKAEIAAFRREVLHHQADGHDELSTVWLIDKLRQLSAV